MSKGSEPFACVLGLDNPGIRRLPSVGSQERSVMVIATKDLDAEVCKVEVDDVHATLVPVEQTDASICRDPEVRGAGIAVHDRDRASPQLHEDLEDLSGHIGGKCAKVSVHTSRRTPELVRNAASGSLRTVDEQRVKPTELRGDEFPIGQGLGFTSVDPSLDDDTVDRSSTVIGRHDGRDEESCSFQIGQEIEFPRQGLCRPAALPDGHATGW
jgi:hypothetical protein